MASNTSSEFREMRLVNSSEIETELQTPSPGKKVCTLFPLRSPLERVLAVIVVVLLVICVIVVALFAVEKRTTKPPEPASEECRAVNGEALCSFSEEARRVGLGEFLRKVQLAYFKYNRGILDWEPGLSDHELFQTVEKRYRPMNYTPEYLKEKTDAALSLYEEIRGIYVNETKLKPREAKAVDQVKLFLRTIFGAPYDENFYSGDWMLGPNHFCLQSICRMPTYISDYSFNVQPRSLKELEHILRIIRLHGDSVKQYQSNMQLGVKSGMVRSVYVCKSGLNTFKTHYKVTTKENNPNDVLKERFVSIFRNASFIQDLSRTDQLRWLKSKGKNVSTSIDEALVEGIGKPIIEFVKYLEDEHMRHCLPKDLSSGLAGIPVDHIYIDGGKTIIPTHKFLPITGQKLSGKGNYKTILPAFTTSDITPDEINKIGVEILNVLYPQAVAIARNVTGELDNDTAIREFKKILNTTDQFFNDEPFPANESDATAHKNCQDPESATLHCPKRWEAMTRWIDYYHQILSRLAPKLIPSFYHTGNKISIPNCPLEIIPDFDPSMSVQSYQTSRRSCTYAANMAVPFFRDNFGPKFADRSTVAHEAWPGHHTQMQGLQEYFSDPCGGVLHWLNARSDYSFFVEGWALYAENPVVAEDTDAYDGKPLEKYGMLQWQIWRALRLIVDTGLHHRGMNRTEALGLFSKYAWDDSDLSAKEVTRYQGTPGQATAYTLGQQKIVQLREYCEQELGDKFELREFHYQILSMGSAPERYLDKHIKQFVKCMLDDDLDADICDYILHPMPQGNGGDSYKMHEMIRRPGVSFPRRYL